MDPNAGSVFREIYMLTASTFYNGHTKHMHLGLSSSFFQRKHPDVIFFRAFDIYYIYKHIRLWIYLYRLCLHWPSRHF